jgi:hypothetical protein
MGPGGYKTAELKWDMEKDAMREKGIEPEIEEWPRRSGNWVLGHGAIYNLQTGKLVRKKEQVVVPLTAELYSRHIWSVFVSDRLRFCIRIRTLSVPIPNLKKNMVTNTVSLLSVRIRSVFTPSPEALPGTLSERGIATGGLLHRHACLRRDE